MVNDKLTLILPDNVAKTNASIYQINGTIAKTVELHSNTNTVDVKDLMAGIYIFKIDNNTMPFTQKFIKQN